MRKRMGACGLVILCVLALLIWNRSANAIEPADVDCSGSDPPTKLGWHRCPWKPYFSIGPSMAALSFNLDSRKIGLFDQSAALELHTSFLQSWLIKSYQPDPNDKNKTTEIHRLSLWELAFGVQVRKEQASGDVTFGCYLVPWGIRVDSFAVGVGLSYLTIGTVENGLSHWSIILPVTYQVNI
jgi:hypothetical protein